jgi:hypothetical protein
MTKYQIDLNTIIDGAVCYDSSGGNVVVSGTAFYEAIDNGGYLGTQLIGGDGEGTEVAGNLAVYGLFTYTDASNFLSWGAANSTASLGLEIVANELLIDADLDGDCDLTDRYVLDAGDTAADYLTATFAELAQWGYTEIAEGIWADIAVGGEVPAGQIAVSVVIENYTNENWADAGITALNADFLAATLGEGTPGVRRDSGITVTVIPEPATLALLTLGGLFLRRKK